MQELGWERQDYVVSTKVPVCSCPSLHTSLLGCSSTRLQCYIGRWSQVCWVLMCWTMQVFFGVSGAKLNARGLSRKHVIEGVQARLSQGSRQAHFCRMVHTSAAWVRHTDICRILPGSPLVCMAPLASGTATRLLACGLCTSLNSLTSRL